MAQKVEAPATKPELLSSSPRIHVVEGENEQLPKKLSSNP